MVKKKRPPCEMPRRCSQFGYVLHFSTSQLLDDNLACNWMKSDARSHRTFFWDRNYKFELHRKKTRSPTQLQFTRGEIPRCKHKINSHKIYFDRDVRSVFSHWRVKRPVHNISFTCLLMFTSMWARAREHTRSMKRYHRWIWSPFMTSGISCFLDSGKNI